MRALAFGALVAGCAVFSVLVKNELRADHSPIESLQIGQPMPDFTLTDRSGAQVALHQVLQENKIVAINFWASWCGPCRLEMPGFEKAYATKHGDGFGLLGINEDDKREDMDAYLAKKPVTFPVLLDADSALMKRLGVRALPTTVLVGGDGRIRMVTEGVQEYLEIFVDAQLKAAPTEKKTEKKK
jgi:peroxiredoxin